MSPAPGCDAGGPQAKAKAVLQPESILPSGAKGAGLGSEGPGSRLGRKLTKKGEYAKLTI